MLCVVCGCLWSFFVDRCYLTFVRFGCSLLWVVVPCCCSLCAVSVVVAGCCRVVVVVVWWYVLFVVRCCVLVLFACCSLFVWLTVVVCGLSFVADVVCCVVSLLTIDV